MSFIPEKIGVFGGDGRVFIQEFRLAKWSEKHQF